MTTCPSLVLLRAVTWPAVLSLSAGAVLLGSAGVALGPASKGSASVTAAATLLAATAAFTLAEASAAIVDVTPTGSGRRAAVRAYALSVPLLAGVGLLMAIHARDAVLSTTDLAVAVVGNVVLGFAAAGAGRRASAEPGVLVADAGEGHSTAPVVSRIAEHPTASTLAATASFMAPMPRP